MLDLEGSIARFVTVLGKHNISATFEPMEQSMLTKLTEGVPVSHALYVWYRYAAPKQVEIPWYTGTLSFFSPSNLVDMQIGYRWIGKKHGPQDEQWDENWVVIGDVLADPIIADVSEPQTPILMDFHGTGEWKPKTVSSSLAEFLLIMTIWVEISVGKYGNRFTQMTEYDEEFVIRLREDFSEALAPILSADHRRNLFELLG